MEELKGSHKMNAGTIRCQCEHSKKRHSPDCSYCMCKDFQLWTEPPARNIKGTGRRFKAGNHRVKADSNP